MAIAVRFTGKLHEITDPSYLKGVLGAATETIDTMRPSRSLRHQGLIIPQAHLRSKYVELPN